MRRRGSWSRTAAWGAVTLAALLSAACGSGPQTSVDTQPPVVVDGPVVSVWLTLGDRSKRLEQQADVRFATGLVAPAVTTDVDETRTYQEIDGFGASLTDSAAWVLDHDLAPADRDAVMEKLFSPTAGIGLSLLRQPMGASDFARFSYTYDDTPGDAPDPALAHFSIAHDRDAIVPLLQQARALNPHLRLMATPWSPPAWMKTSRSLIGGRLQPEYRGALADYFVRFIQAYGALGLPIDFVSVQNEPHYEPPSYPGMRMEPDEQATVIRDHLGPALAAHGLATRILVWDHNWDEPSYPLAVLADAGARAFAAGTAFHCYAGSVDAQSQVNAAYPDKGVWFTECSGGDWSPDYATNLRWNAHNLLVGALRNWARSVILWNLALDQNRGPTNGGCADCRGVVTVDARSGTVSYEVEYEVLGHLSKFVTPGATRIDSTSFDGRLETVAFRNPDGSRVLLAYNASSASDTFGLRWSGQTLGFALPAGAVATFTW